MNVKVKVPEFSETDVGALTFEIEKTELVVDDAKLTLNIKTANTINSPIKENIFEYFML